MPIVYNAANEMCVKAFLDRKIAFLDIARIVEAAMMRAQLPSITSPSHGNRDMETALAVDCSVRDMVQGLFATVA
jgi:1-deoxy-D-xylulose-5-phosphate reductoisomerase